MPDSPDAPLHNRKHLKRRRQRLRTAAPPAERALWTMLQERLIVELDGAAHADPARRDYDEERPHFLVENGFTVLRFANEQVFEHPDMVCAAIAQHVSDP